MQEVNAVTVDDHPGETKVINMTFMAEQDDSSAPFLLIWGLFALAIGGTLVTKRWSSRFRNFVTTGLASQQPLSPVQAERVRRARAVPTGFLRLIAGVFVVLGAAALATSVVMFIRR
ncbi:hypothetical protein [Streptomyces sp. NPDC093970]|uniref:hypothetical protein n=1 Tax=Streptomyces sp. NPDC093970 TaxID=3155076 RepID=UPI0034150752